MTRDNLLFSIMGILFGFILGFVFVTVVNQGAPTAVVAGKGQQQSRSVLDLPKQSDLPSGGASNGAADAQAMQAGVQAAIKVARDQPGNFNAQVEAAELHYQIRDYDQAIEFYGRANKDRPNDYGVIVKLGDANYDAGHYEEAERWYYAALAQNPDDVNVRTDLGSSFFERTPPDYDRAIKEFRTSLEHDPRHELTLHNLVLAYLRKGDAREAKAALDKLKEVSPNNPDIPGFTSQAAALSGK